MGEPDPIRARRDEPAAKRILQDFGFFGYYLHLHRGGRNGKQHILLTLLLNGSEMTQRKLQERSCITSASLSEVVAKLEAEGLVTRKRSDADRRQLTITLSGEGTARAHEVLREWERFDELALACLDQDEVADLADKLDRVAAHWMEMDEARKGEGPCNRS